MADNLADLTDLIATHWRSLDLLKMKYTCSCGDWEYRDDDRERAYASWCEHLALAVEQHNNRRITELEERASVAEVNAENWSKTYRLGIDVRDVWRTRAEKAEATIARVEKLAHDMRGWCSPHGISVTYSDRIVAAVRGEPK